MHLYENMIRLSRYSDKQKNLSARIELTRPSEYLFYLYNAINPSHMS